MKKIETKKWKDFLVKDVFIIEKKGKKYIKNVKKAQKATQICYTDCKNN